MISILIQIETMPCKFYVYNVHTENLQCHLSLIRLLINDKQKLPTQSNEFNSLTFRDKRLNSEVNFLFELIRFSKALLNK